MKDALIDGIEELKRVDHLIFVSLKYTRTVDVIRSIIDRIMNSFNAVIDGVMEKLESSQKIMEIPIAFTARVNLMKKEYNDEKLNEYLDFYLYLRLLYRAEFTRSGEFRKNVTMTSDVDGKSVEINIVKIMEFYEKTKEFLHHIQDKEFGKDE